jgi:hypothetical protein
MVHLTAIIGAVFVATSCSGFTDSETGRVVGIISTGGPEPRAIEAPDTVQLGVAFAATVHSFGNGCTRADGVELTLEPALARVTPFDRIPVDDDVVCADVLARIPHPLELHFTVLGTATIVAEGMMSRASGEQIRVTVTKDIVVVP